MNIYVNSKPQELPLQAKIKDALAALGITSLNGIAIAINNTVVPKNQWDTHELNAEDKVMLIKATQGG